MPGTVAGLALAHQKYGSGKFTLAQLIAPAIVLARDGIPVEDDIADSLPYVRERAGALALIGEDFSAPRRQRAAARRPLGAEPTSPARSTAIARDGPRAFYEGPIAEQASPPPCARPAG